jgi:hypothetical protein
MLCACMLSLHIAHSSHISASYCTQMLTYTHACMHTHTHTHVCRDVDNNRLRTLPPLFFSDSPRIKTFRICGNADLQCFPQFLSLPPELYPQIQDSFSAENATATLNQSSVSGSESPTNSTGNVGAGAGAYRGAGYARSERQVYVNQGIAACPAPRMVRSRSLYTSVCVCVCVCVCMCVCVKSMCELCMYA